MRILWRLFICFSLLLAQQGWAFAEESIPVGGLLVLTGQYAMQGAAFREGLELAVDEINSEGGISGRKIKLHLEDSANLPTNALTSARKLITQHHVVAAITTSFPELSTGALEFQKSMIPVVHLWDSSPEIEEMGEYIFGIGPWTPSSGEVSAQFVRKKLNAATVVTVHINDPWSELVTGYFTKEFEKLGGRVLRSFAFNPHENDFRSGFTAIRALKPDAIYSPITDNVVPFYTQLHQANTQIPVVSSDVIADEHIKQAPKAFENVYQSQIKDPSGPHMEKLAAAYKRKFGRSPGLPWFVATGYDGIKIIGECMKKKGIEPHAIRDCIASLKDLEGISQTISFNEGGSSLQKVSIFQIKNGKFQFQWKD